MTHRALIFDFYGVICTEIGSNWYKKRVDSTVSQELHDQYDHPADIGEISGQEFFAGIAGAVDQTPHEVEAEWVEAAKFDEELLRYIHEWKKSGYLTAICSNAEAEFFYRITQRTDLKPFFDTIVLSSEVGAAKPDPVIFNAVLEQLEVKNDEAIFIDDRQSNVTAAETLGIKSFLYTSVETLKDDLSFLL